MSHRATAILIVGASLLSVIFMRQLHELKWISYFFMFIMFSFLGLLVVELQYGGANHALTIDNVKVSKFDHHTVTAFSIIIFAYNIQFLVFPAFAELKNRTNARFSVASGWSHLVETFAYISIGLIAIVMFGPESIKPDMLENLAERPGFFSLLTRAIFCLLLIFDVPFLFFATKVQSLVLHNEVVNQSIEKQMEAKLQQKKNDFVFEDADEEEQ